MGQHKCYILAALLSALLFSLSAPRGKLLLADMPPLPLAGLLYLGSGLGLVSLALGFVRGDLLPAPAVSLMALFLGAFSYSL